MKTQTILGDMKSQELFALLQRDRAADKISAKSQIAYRNSAETVLGEEEHLFKIVYVGAAFYRGGIANAARYQEGI